jgi:hypothetical protein
MKIKKIAFICCATFCIASCGYNTLRQIRALPTVLHEISGMTSLNGTTVWAHNDSGGEPNIYEIDVKTAAIQRILTIENAKNIDWEEITHDEKENMYIGDFGNNKHRRKDLCIYKIPPITSQNIMQIPSEKIQFSYRDQSAFPPKKKKRNFNCEAFIHYKNNLYLFSKNNTRPYNGYTKCYKLSDQAGTHIAEPIDSFRTGDTMLLSFITAATISPNQKKLVLLSSDKIFVFSDFEGDNFFKGKYQKILLGNFSQKEAIVFLDNQTLVISDEKPIKLVGGNLYKIKIK